MSGAPAFTRTRERTLESIWAQPSRTGFYGAAALTVYHDRTAGELVAILRPAKVMSGTAYGRPIVELLREPCPRFSQGALNRAAGHALWLVNDAAPGSEIRAVAPDGIEALA